MGGFKGNSGIPDQYEAEIKLAERGFHILMERIALRRMPKDALPTGDVYDLLNAAGEQLEIQALQNEDRKISKRRLKKAAQAMVSAIESLTAWPEEPRLRVAAELVSTLRTAELDSAAESLLVALQRADAFDSEIPEDEEEIEVVIDDEPEDAADIPDEAEEEAHVPEETGETEEQEKAEEPEEPGESEESEVSEEPQLPEGPDEADETESATPGETEKTTDAEADLPEEKEAASEPAADDPLTRLRKIISSGEWDPELDGLLGELREISAEDPDDENLREYLERGILFNTIAGRRHLLIEERRRLAEAESLPDELADALDRIPEHVVDSELVRLSLHLVLSDLVAAGLVPKKVSPEMTVAATLVATQRQDEPGRKPDTDPLGSWAGTNRLKLDVLSDDITPVFAWKPADYDGATEIRHERRWRVRSLSNAFLPVRWTPPRDSDSPPYTLEAARERIEELREVVWLMVDWMEPVRFVSESFTYGDGAPDEMDLEIVRDVVALWESEAVVRAREEIDQSYLEDGWQDDDWDEDLEGAADALPEILTAEGESLIFSTVTFEISEGAEQEIVELLDAAEGFERDEDKEGDTWVWFGPRFRSEKVHAKLSLTENLLTVETQTISWSSKANARLAEELGDRIVLSDIRTEQPTPELVAERAPEVALDEEGPAISNAEQMRVVHEVLERHYRSWPDEPLEVLGDITPREAVVDPVRCEEVIGLLLEIEDRTRTSTWPMNKFDFGFLWEDLGLDRSESD